MLITRVIDLQKQASEEAQAASVEEMKATIDDVIITLLGGEVDVRQTETTL